jgi:molybdopterin molybdotransferase
MDAGNINEQMINFDEAYNLIQSFACTYGEERISLSKSLARILAEDVVADMDMPSFNRSAMDGYACRRSDLDQIVLKIIEEIPAGKTPEKVIEEGTCARIMTGAEIPEGADCVIKVEDTRLKTDGMVEISAKDVVPNIRFAGEDLKEGDVLIPQGTLINKQHFGLMAMVGYIDPVVYSQLRVGILSTGSELVAPGKQPGVSGIRNSNGPQLWAQLHALGIDAQDFGIVKDDREKIKQSIESRLANLDMLLISGGISMGDYDFVPEILKELGFDIKIHKIRVRPGKPLLFATRKDTFVFGLPGNPVSTFVQFEVMIKPFLLKCMGIREEPECIKMVMGSDLSVKKIPLRYFVPVKFRGGEIYPIEYHGSGHLAAYTEANGILEIPENTNYLKKNDLAYVRPI